MTDMPRRCGGLLWLSNKAGWELSPETVSAELQASPLASSFLVCDVNIAETPCLPDLSITWIRHTIALCGLLAIELYQGEVDIVAVKQTLA